MPSTPSQQVHRIRFEPGATSRTILGRVLPGDVDQYVVRASADQVMHARVDSPVSGILLEVTDRDGTPIKARVEGETSWRGTLPASQDYLINIVSPAEATDYQLRIIVYARIEFPSGETSATLSAQLDHQQTHHYVLAAQRSQMMEVVVDALKQVGLTIVGEDGIPLKRYVDEEQKWLGELPATQDYFIKIVATEATQYTLTIKVLPRSPETSIELVSPSGGEEWLEGTTHQILWRSSGVETVNVAVASGGKAWDIAVGIDASSAPLAWEIPVGLISNFGISASDAMRVRVSSSEQPDLYGETDEPFTVRCPRIQFEPGATSASLTGLLDSSGDQFRYVLNAEEGQTMTMAISPAQITVDVWGASDGSTWDILGQENELAIPSLPATQVYFITLTSEPQARTLRYNLEITIE